MTRAEISRASTRRLRERLAEIAADLVPAHQLALDAEQERILDELAGREHDLNDPSAAIPGLHLPS